MIFLILHLDTTVNSKKFSVGEKESPDTVKRKGSMCASG